MKKLIYIELRSLGLDTDGQIKETNEFMKLQIDDFDKDTFQEIHRCVDDLAQRARNGWVLAEKGETAPETDDEPATE